MQLQVVHELGRIPDAELARRGPDGTAEDLPQPVMILAPATAKPMVRTGHDCGRLRPIVFRSGTVMNRSSSTDCSREPEREMPIARNELSGAKAMAVAASSSPGMSTAAVSRPVRGSSSCGFHGERRSFGNKAMASCRESEEKPVWIRYCDCFCQSTLPVAESSTVSRRAALPTESLMITRM